jgi:TatA/E family protein of Tat protein translocase
MWPWIPSRWRPEVAWCGYRGPPGDVDGEAWCGKFVPKLVGGGERAGHHTEVNQSLGTLIETPPTTRIHMQPAPMALAGLGPAEVLIILLVLVLVFGAKKLPELARGSGQALRIFKAETRGLAEDESNDAQRK